MELDKNQRFLTAEKVLLKILRCVLAGTALAFLLSFLALPLLEPARILIEPYIMRPLPHHVWAQASVAALCIFLIAVLAELSSKIRRSVKLILRPLQRWIWVPAATVFWLAYELNHPRIAWGTIAVGLLLTAAYRISIPRNARRGGELEPDLPITESGMDLLGRHESVQRLASIILLEQPQVIAITGGYGDGKTSFLNLTINEFRKLGPDDLPVIVRFNPWLAGDSNALVLSLLRSIVAEINTTFVVPGLGRDAARYARTLLSAIPKVHPLKDLVAEASQEKQIDSLAKAIGRTGHRVLVVLDDLDRMEAKELETVFKVLRGSDELSTIAFTFLCCFDPSELALILRTTRPHQDTRTFIEKFFPVQFPLPKIDQADLRNVLIQKIDKIVNRYAASTPEDVSKSLTTIWDDGAGLYFGNLRRIKLFLNKISNALELIGSEVNVEDFIRLELIRDIAPSLYEQIFRNPEYFWNSGFAFEVRYGHKGFNFLDSKEAEKERAAFYEQIKGSLPEDKRYVLTVMEDIFPLFAGLKKKFRIKPISATEAENDRRICHPRHFRQYFLLKVPSELFSQKEFRAFVSSIKKSTEDEAAAAFSSQFRLLLNEDFKRYHFVHLIENAFNEFDIEVARGLCIGLARESSAWPQGDAFELLAAIGLTRETLGKMSESSARKDLLSKIVRQSGSDLYTLLLFWRTELELKERQPVLGPEERFRAYGFSSLETDKLLSDFEEVRGNLKEHLRVRYLMPSAPSVFEQFGAKDPALQRVEPIQFLFAWRSLGPDAEHDQKEYLSGLLARSPRDLNEFLKAMFRAFIDDYPTLKPLIDYTGLAKLIAAHEDLLDSEKVRQFRTRNVADSGSSTQS